MYDALFGDGDGTIFLDQVVCSGNESRLFDCRNSGVGVHSCTPGSDAGVVCPGKLNMPWCQTKYMGAFIVWILLLVCVPKGKGIN